MKDKDAIDIMHENNRMRDALETIEIWALPVVQTEDGMFCSYESVYGSDGAKEFVRNIASEALWGDKS